MARQASDARRAAFLALVGLVALAPLATGNLSGVGIGSRALLFDPVNLPRLVVVLIGVCLTSALLMWSAAKSPTALRVHPVLYLLLGVAALAVASAWASADWRRSILGDPGYLEGAVTWLLYPALFALALQLVSSASRLRSVGWAAVGASTILSLHGIAQRLGIDRTSYLVENPGFDVRQSFASFGNPNFLAGMLVLALPVAVALALSSDRKSAKIMAWTASGLVLAAIVSTVTRGAWLAVLVEIALLVVFASRGVLRFERIDAYAVAAVVVVAALLAGAAGGLRGVAPSVGAGSSVHQRLLGWQAAFGAAAERPVLGYGPDAFLSAFRRHRPPAFTSVFGAREVMQSAHSWPLQAAATLGLPAALLFFAALFWALRVGAAAAARVRGNAVYTGIWVACVGYLVHMLFNVAVHGATTVFFVFLGTLCAPAARDAQVRLGGRAAIASAAAAALLLVGAAVFCTRLVGADAAYLRSRLAMGGMATGDAVGEARKAAGLDPLSVTYERGFAQALSKGFYAAAEAGEVALARSLYGESDAQFARTVARHPDDYAAWAWRAALAAAGSTALDGTDLAVKARAYARDAEALDVDAVEVKAIAEGSTTPAAVETARSVWPLP